MGIDPGLSEADSLFLSIVTTHAVHTVHSFDLAFDYCILLW